MANVLVVTTYGQRKDYCASFLPAVLHGLEGAGGFMTLFDGVPPVTGLPGEVLEAPDLSNLSYYGRVATVRQLCRNFFLSSGKWTHLYFHDCDMIPPSDILPRLLAHERPVASGLYVLRGLTEPVVPAVVNFEAGPAGILCTNLGAIQSESNTWPVQSFGMGCMLIEREVLDATEFRMPEWFEENLTGEDYAWCQDAFATKKAMPIVDLSATCWHVNNDGRASRLLVGPLEYAVTWIDTPYSIRNKQGEWHRGQPRFGLSLQDTEDLGPGFDKRMCRRTTLEWKTVEEIVR